MTKQTEVPGTLCFARKPVRLLLALLLALALAAAPVTTAFADLDTATGAPTSDAAGADPNLVSTNDGYKSLDGEGGAAGGVDNGSGGTAAAGAAGGDDGQGATGAAGGGDGVANADGSADDPAYPGAEQLHISLSAPEFEQHGNVVWYTTKLSISGISSFYGYQIQVESDGGEGSVVIKSLVGGTATAPTYKDGSTYQAVIFGSEGLSGDVVVCEITKKVSAEIASASSSTAALSLVVLKIDAITNMGAGLMLSLGPDPAAVTLALPSVGNGLMTGILPGSQIVLIYIILALFLVVLLIWFVRFAKKLPRNRRSTLSSTSGSTDTSAARHARG